MTDRQLETMAPVVERRNWTQPRLLREAVRVVIIDDHLLVAESIAATLDATDDLQVVGVADSCATGLRVVETEQPDVLLLDQRLEDGLGTELLPRLLLLCPTMRVLLVTAVPSDDVLVRAIEGGCAGFVAKGERAATLVQAVRSAANNEAVIRPDALRRVLPRLAHVAQRRGDDLTAREREVLGLLVAGKSTQAMADDLVIAPATARNHVQSIMVKLRAHSRLEAVSIALRESIAQAP